MRLPLHQEALLRTMRPLNPTDEELAMMSPQEREVVPELLKRNVFGEDYATDRQGNPVEQGFGAPGRHTPNHWAALRKAEQMGMEAPGTTERLMREAGLRAGAPVVIQPASAGPATADIVAELQRQVAELKAMLAQPRTKRRGNIEGLAKARAAMKAKREAEKSNG